MPDLGTIAFDVERFAWATGDRLELSGRWSGIRGVRFVRPTLVLVDGDDHRRLLATLDDKPWPAEDGKPWTAAFPWEGEPMDAEAAELSVAPGIVLRVSPPDVPDGRRRVREGGASAEPAPPGRRGLVQRAADTERAEAALAQERAARVRLEQEHTVLTRERDALRRERDGLLRDRDEAVRGRDAAIRERDTTAVVRDRLERERATLAEARDDLRAERDALLRRLEVSG